MITRAGVCQHLACAYRSASRHSAAGHGATAATPGIPASIKTADAERKWLYEQHRGRSGIYPPDGQLPTALDDRAVPAAGYDAGRAPRSRRPGSGCRRPPTSTPVPRGLGHDERPRVNTKRAGHQHGEPPACIPVRQSRSPRLNRRAALCARSTAALRPYTLWIMVASVHPKSTTASASLPPFSRKRDAEVCRSWCG